MFRISDLQHKDIINTLDGKKLGYIRDVELDLGTGKVRAIVLPGEGRFWGFWSRNEDIVIDWQQIKKIGIDAVLVELHQFTPSKKQRGQEIVTDDYTRIPPRETEGPAKLDKPERLDKKDIYLPKHKPTDPDEIKNQLLSDEW